MNTETTTSSPHPYYDDNDDVIDLRFLVQLLKSHQWFILTITLIVVVLAGCYAFTRPAMYESTALIKVNADSNASASNMMAMLGMTMGSSAAGGAFSASPVEVETALIKSDYIMGAVADDLGLNISLKPKSFPLLGPLFSKILASHQPTIKVGVFSVPKTSEALSFELMRENAQGDYVLLDPHHHQVLKGKLGKLEFSSDKSVSIQVDAWDKHAKESFIIKKQPNNLVVNRLLSHLVIKEEGERTGVVAISYQSSDPVEAQDILNAILDAAVRANVAEKAAEATKTLAFLQEQLPKITTELDDSERRLNEYRAQTGTVDDKIEAELLMQEIVSLEKDINELNLKKLEMLENFTPKHPYVLAITQKQDKLQEQLSGVKTQLRQLPLTTQEAENFLRDIRVHGDIYSGVMQTVQQMEMLKGSTVSSVRILQEASFPVLPVASKAPLILLVSLILGVSLATAILLLQYSLSKTLDPLLLEKVLGVQVLAIIPYSLSQMKLFREMSAKRQGRKNYLLSEIHPKDTSVEALRSLRTALKLTAMSDDKKVIALSGCSPSAGKSFVSSNLAALLSDLGGRVLLIDADMRKGYMHKIFLQQTSPGLSECLEERVSLERCIHQILPNLDFISAGEKPVNPADLLSRRRFKEMIADMAKQYDFILLDTPPILAVTDANLIFELADIRLLVINAVKDHLKEVQHTKGIFEKAGFSLDGIICNNSDQGKKYGYKGGYYAYTYQYE